MEERKIYSSIFWVYGERVLIQIINLFISILLARILTPYEYGVVALVMIFINITDTLVTGGFGNSLIQKQESTETDFNSVVWLSMIISIILYILLYLLSPRIANFYGNDKLILIIRVLGIKIIFSAFNSVQQAYIQKKMLFKKYFFSTLIGTILSGIVSFAIINLNLGVWILVVQQLVNTIVSTFVLYCINDWRIRFEFSMCSIIELWDFSYKILISMIIYTIKDNLRQFFISKYFTTKDLAYYNQGNKYPTIVATNIIEALVKIIFPLLSMNQKNRKKMKEIMRITIRISSFILTPCMIGIFILSDILIEVLLTEKWLESVPFMRILCIVYMTRTITTVLQRGVLATGNSSINLYHELITSLLTILFIIISIIKYHSIFLIAWSYVIVSIIGLLIYIYYTQKIFKYTILEIIFDYFPALILSIAMGVSIIIFGKCFNNNLLKLFFQINFAIIVYLGLAYIFKIESFFYLKNIILKNKVKL